MPRNIDGPGAATAGKPILDDECALLKFDALAMQEAIAIVFGNQRPCGTARPMSRGM
jgi:hypothetical protein